MQRPSLRSGALLAAATLTLALGGAPLLATGADHLDAPALGGLSAGGVFSPHSDHGDRDINDVYVFQGSNSSRTVLAMTTNPAVNVPSVDPFTNFGTNVRYILNVDRNGNAVPGSRLRLALRRGQWRRPDLHGHPLHGHQRRTSLKQGVDVGWGSTGGTGIGTAKDGGEGLRGRAERSVLLRPDRVRRHGLRGRHGQPQGDRWQRQRLLRRR